MTPADLCVFGLPSGLSRSVLLIEQCQTDLGRLTRSFATPHDEGSSTKTDARHAGLPPPPSDAGSVPTLPHGPPTLPQSERPRAPPIGNGCRLVADDVCLMSSGQRPYSKRRRGDYVEPFPACCCTATWLTPSHRQLFARQSREIPREIAA